jgi:hypothetical protein
MRTMDFMTGGSLPCDSRYVMLQAIPRIKQCHYTLREFFPNAYKKLKEWKTGFTRS